MALNDEFRAVVGKWANVSVPEQLLGVARIAIQDTAEDVIDGTPVDTGFLVANWQPSFDEPADSIVAEGLGNGYASSQISLVLMDMKLGQMFYYSNNAVYARRINYGFVGEDSLGRHYNQAGVHMVEQAVGKWQTNVEMAAAQMGLA